MKKKTGILTFQKAINLGASLQAFALNKYIDLNMGVRYVDYGKIKHEHATTHIDATEFYIGAAYKFGLFD